MYSKEVAEEIMKTVNDLSKTLALYCNQRAQLCEVEAYLLAADAFDGECSVEEVEKAKGLKDLAKSNIDLGEKLIELYCETLIILSKRH